MKTFFLLILTLAQAQTQSYFSDGKEIKVYFKEEMRLTSTIECKLNAEKNECTNFDFIKKLSSKNVNKKTPGGIDIGGEICKTILMGKSMIFRDKDNNERAFCKISETLYVDNGSIEYLADKNDGVVYGGRKRIPRN